MLYELPLYSGKNPPTDVGGFLRSLVMKMLILSKKNCVSSFDGLSIPKNYVRSVSIFKNLSKNF